MTTATSTEEEASPLDSCSPPRETDHPQARDGDALFASVDAATESKREGATTAGEEEEATKIRPADDEERLVAPAAAAAAVPPPPLPSPPPPPPPLPLQRSRRVAGGADPASACPSLSRLLALIEGDSQVFQWRGAVLRVKQYLRADAGPRELDAVIDALRKNTRVQALYLQNFERGMGDAQLERLTETLKVNRNIWALNVGENFEIGLPAWRDFAGALEETSVSFLYVSEHHLLRSSPPLKPLMRAAIRRNRDRLLLEGRIPPVGLAKLVKNMWWNPTSWLERLGVGTRTPRDSDGSAVAVVAGGGGGGGGEMNKSTKSTRSKKGAAALPLSLARRADKGSYEPSRRPTSRSGAASRAAEGRKEGWEALRKSAREEVARRTARAAAERLRRRREEAEAEGEGAAATSF